MRRARPQDTAEFRQRALVEAQLPSLKKKVVWLFITCVVPLCAPIAAVGWGLWYLKRKDDLKALPPLHQGLCKIGLGVGVGQLALLVLLGGMYAALRSG